MISTKKPTLATKVTKIELRYLREDGKLIKKKTVKKWSDAGIVLSVWTHFGWDGQELDITVYLDDNDKIQFSMPIWPISSNFFRTFDLRSHVENCLDILELVYGKGNSRIANVRECLPTFPE